MKNSAVGDQWIAEMCRLNPMKKLDSGAILTGPVRLSFTDAVFEAKPQMKGKAESGIKYQVSLLFPPQSVQSLQILWDEYFRICKEEFSSSYVSSSNSYVGLDESVIDQGKKANLDGYTPGCWYTKVSANPEYKPAVVDSMCNPITDRGRVYPGAWAIAAINPYASGKNTPRKGPRFGFGALMMVGDDTRLGGGGVDAQTAFKDVNVQAPMAATAAFGQALQAPQPGQQMGAGGGQAAINTIYGQSPDQQALAPALTPAQQWAKDNGVPF
jgi:hypothetical protein